MVFFSIHDKSKGSFWSLTASRWLCYANLTWFKGEPVLLICSFTIGLTSKPMFLHFTSLSSWTQLSFKYRESIWAPVENHFAGPVRGIHTSHVNSYHAHSDSWHSQQGKSLTH
jgi:hypothetical protein